MSRGDHTNAVEAGVSPAFRSRLQPTRLPLQKNDVGIRDARLSDVVELAALACELGYKTTDVEMATRLKTILKDARYKTLVAEIGGKLCGMIGTVAHSSYLHNDFSGRIIALVVSNKMRKRGVGRKLVAAVEKDFLERKITRVTLTTRFEREEAHRFYEKLGYARTGFRFGRNLRRAAN
jgi:ribosomal protein S18 acetylase RimI-like enzyme